MDAALPVVAGDRSPRQGSLLVEDASYEPAARSMRFRDSLRHEVHRWYPYVEGFSAPYVTDKLLEFGPRLGIYDPFGGAGTTQLTASCLGLPSWYSEVNPFMAFVAETKVNSARWARTHLEASTRMLEQFLRRVRSSSFQRTAGQLDLDAYHSAFPGRNYFEAKDIRELLAGLKIAEEVAQETPAVRDLLRLACAANAVRASNMTRRADLRRRRSDEYKTRVVDVAGFLTESVTRILSDLSALPRDMKATRKVAEDCRQMGSSFYERFDLAITSPPYLNGTNYFRNTKIELWLLGFMQGERDLSAFRRRAVAAGINNVARDTSSRRIASVETVAERLDEVAKDARIPLLVRQYFSQMWDALVAVFRSLVTGARFVVDIGDSRFYGVNVPTDVLLCEIGEEVGFHLESRTVLAARSSYDKTPLSQVELVLRKPPSG